MTALALLFLAQAAAPIADVPFEHTPGRIWLKATLNGKPARAILDTGAGGIIASVEAAERTGGIKGDAFSTTGLGDTPVSIWNATGLELGLAGTDVRIPVGYIGSAAPAKSDVHFDVAVGFHFFLRYVVEIDYVHSRLRLYNPFTFTPAGFTALPLRFWQGCPVATAKLQLPGKGARKIDVLLDTGAPVPVDVTRRMAKREKLDRQYKDLPTVDTPGGVSGGVRARIVHGIKGEFGGLPLSGQALISITEGGTDGTGVDYDAILGDDVLRRFDLVFDYLNGRVWVRPNKR